jgi:hypothetical protein
MFDSLKTVAIYCANETELNNLMRWLYRGRISLSHTARGTYPVEVILPALEGMAVGENIRGFYVRVPLDKIKPMLNKLEVQSAFSKILRP